MTKEKMIELLSEIELLCWEEKAPVRQRIAVMCEKAIEELKGEECQTQPVKNAANG